MKENIESPRPALQVNGVSLDFSHKKALDSVSARFVSGKIHALVGENGAGKSCLADILCGIKQPSGGTILLNDNPVCFSSSTQALKAGIAVVRQRPVLLEKAVFGKMFSLVTAKITDRFFASKRL